VGVAGFHVAPESCEINSWLEHTAPIVTPLADTTDLLQFVGDPGIAVQVVPESDEMNPLVLAPAIIFFHRWTCRLIANSQMWLLA
jgi:hypothetical protein